MNSRPTSMMKRASPILLVGGILATCWLGGVALLGEPGKGRARSPDGASPITESVRETRILEGAAVQASGEKPESTRRSEDVVETRSSAPPDAGRSAESGASPETVWVGPLLVALSKAPTVQETQTLLEREGRDLRRAEQIERLRQRESVDLLDHIRGGLAWLALQQGAEGHFLRDHPSIWATGLALLALVEFRDHDEAGVFEPSIAAAARWLTAQWRADGAFLGRGEGDFVDSASALMGLSRAAESSGDEKLRAAVEAGLAHIARLPALSKTDQPNTFGASLAGAPNPDLQTLVWVAEAVEVARRAEIPVPEGLEPRLRTALDGLWLGEHRFRRTSPGGDYASISPLGMRMGYILWETPDPDVLSSWRKWLAGRADEPRPSPHELYYGVRMVITLERGLPDPWHGWVLALADEQIQEGPEAGSFPHWARFSQTVMAVLTLEHALYSR